MAKSLTIYPRLLGVFIRKSNSVAALGPKLGFFFVAIPIQFVRPTSRLSPTRTCRKLDPPEAFWPGAPDLAIEVLSPGDTIGRGRREDRRMACRRLCSSLGRRSKIANRNDLSFADGCSDQGGRAILWWRPGCAGLFLRRRRIISVARLLFLHLLSWRVKLATN